MLQTTLTFCAFLWAADLNPGNSKARSQAKERSLEARGPRAWEFEARPQAQS